MILSPCALESRQAGHSKFERMAASVNLA